MNCHLAYSALGCYMLLTRSIRFEQLTGGPVDWQDDLNSSVVQIPGKSPTGPADSCLSLPRTHLQPVTKLFQAMRGSKAKASGKNSSAPGEAQIQTVSLCSPLVCWNASLRRQPAKWVRSIHMNRAGCGHLLLSHPFENFPSGTQTLQPTHH